MAHQGGCLCGAIRLSIAADPIATRQCWCRLCQALSAGGGTVNAIFPAEAVTITGTPRWFASIADSGNHLHRGFCPTCGTPLLSRADERPDLLIVRAGALDDPELAAPQALIWTDAAPGWACFPSDLPRIARQPPPIDCR